MKIEKDETKAINKPIEEEVDVLNNAMKKVEISPKKDGEAQADLTEVENALDNLSLASTTSTEEDGIITSSTTGAKLLSRAPAGPQGVAVARGNEHYSFNPNQSYSPGQKGKRSYNDGLPGGDSSKYSYMTSVSQGNYMPPYPPAPHHHHHQPVEHIDSSMLVQNAPWRNPVPTNGTMVPTNGTTMVPTNNLNIEEKELNIDYSTMGDPLNIMPNIGGEDTCPSFDGDEFLQAFNEDTEIPHKLDARAALRDCLAAKQNNKELAQMMNRSHLNSTGQSPAYSDYSHGSPNSDFGNMASPPQTASLSYLTTQVTSGCQIYGPSPSPDGSTSSGIASPGSMCSSVTSPPYVKVPSPNYAVTSAVLSPQQGTTLNAVAATGTLSPQPQSQYSQMPANTDIASPAMSQDSGYEDHNSPQSNVLSPEEEDRLNDALAIVQSHYATLDLELDVGVQQLEPSLPVTVPTTSHTIPTTVMQTTCPPNTSVALTHVMTSTTSPTTTHQAPIIIVPVIAVQSQPAVPPKGSTGRGKQPIAKKPPVKILPKPGPSDSSHNKNTSTPSPPASSNDSYGAFKTPRPPKSTRGRAGPSKPIAPLTIQPGVPNQSPLPSPTTPQPVIMARRQIANMRSEHMIQQDPDGDTYLGIAICQGDPHMVQALLERYQRDGTLSMIINKPNITFQTPVYLATVTFQPSVVCMLIKHGGDVNKQAEMKHNGNVEYKGPIHYACSYGARGVEVLRALLEALSPSHGQEKLDINAKNSAGLTPLMLAAERHGKPDNNPETRRTINSMQIIRELLSRGGDLSARDGKNGKTSLHYAVESRDLELIREILENYKGNIHTVLNIPMDNGNTCLHLAAGLTMDNIEDHKRLLRLLMSHGADPSLKNQEKIKPKDLVANANSEIVNVLLGKSSQKSNTSSPMSTAPRSMMMTSQPMTSGHYQQPYPSVTQTNVSISQIGGAMPTQVSPMMHTLGGMVMTSGTSGACIMQHQQPMRGVSTPIQAQQQRHQLANTSQYREQAFTFGQQPQMGQYQPNMYYPYPATARPNIPPQQFPTYTTTPQQMPPYQ